MGSIPLKKNIRPERAGKRSFAVLLLFPAGRRQAPGMNIQVSEFCSDGERLFDPIGYATPGKIVRREFHGNLVSRKDLDEILPHLAGNMGKNHVIIFQLDPEHGVRQRFYDGPFNFYGFFFAHYESFH
jgi:hypothetical protein